jgi:hypothetical protein
MRVRRLRASTLARNGDHQLMSIVEGDGINAAEIAAIRQSMNGVPIAGVYPSRHDAKVIERYLAPPRSN